MQFSLGSKTYESARHYALANLFCLVVNANLVEPTYAAHVAELDYSISVSTNGFEAKFNGFSQKLPQLHETVIQQFKSPVCTNAVFTVAHESLCMKYANKPKQPTHLVDALRLQAIMKVRWSDEEILNQLQTISREEFLDYAARLFEDGFVEMLVHGNLTEKDAIILFNKTISMLGIRPLPRGLLRQDDVRVVPIGAQVICEPNRNDDDPNTVVETYFQYEPFDDQTSVILDVLDQLIDEPLFQQLRTEQQLGYQVYCSNRNTFGRLGHLVFVVSQANKFSASTIDVRIEEFLRGFSATLESMQDEEFAQNVMALKAARQKPHSNLSEETSKYWKEIVDRTFQFDRLQREVAILDTLSRLQVCEWFRTHMHPDSPTRRKLSVWVIGAAATSLSDPAAEGADSTTDANAAPVRASTAPTPISLVEFQAQATLWPCLKNAQECTIIKGAYAASLSVSQ
eukprot:m.384629 g.384629  ORF g.384629 m.384629 type:complete len:456 (+) comp56274_c1_seq6:1992-3359(+)